MKVLFIANANRRKDVSPIIKAQAASLEKTGIEVVIYPMLGQGFLGYFKNIYPLNRLIKKEKINIVHAHYSLCGFLASVSTRKPVVTSIMGSFPRKTVKLLMVRFFSKYIWKEVIVKSELTASQMAVKRVHLLPNGVDLDLFYPKEKNVIKQKLGWDISKKQVLFAADPDRTVKNFKLAQQVIEKINKPEIELKTAYSISHTEMADRITAADVLLMTSLSEGSPNVIKEAMACNVPVVTVNVGDVKRTIGTTAGCTIVDSYNADELADAVLDNINIGYTKGRERIQTLDLSSQSVALKIRSIYNKLRK